MEFRILGPLEVAEGGLALPLGGPQDRALLLVLLLRAGEVVSNDQLAEALWGEERPRGADASIRDSMSQLRELLGAHRVVTRPPGYVLELGVDELDAQRARRYLERSRAADARTAVELLREAEALWRGPPLADFAYDSFTQPEIARLDGLRLAILEERIGHELELGRHADLIGELEALVAEHPLQESLRGQLMVALYRAGRQADALRTYQDAREELGVDPGPALRRLHSAILRQDRSLDPPAATGAPAARVDDVARALRAGRLVPILGTEAGALARGPADRFELDAGGGPTRVAQYVALTSGAGPLHDELHALLAAQATPTPVHRFLAALPPLFRELGVPHQLVVTTSHDLALEQAYLDAGEEFDIVSYLATGRHRGKFCHFAPDGTARPIDVPNRYATELSPERRTVILKLHGVVDPAHDYIDHLPHAVPVSLAARLRRSHFLLLGYGVLERNVLLRLWGTEGTDYRSWAVAFHPDRIERAFWRTHDIELLEAPLEDFVETLAHGLGLGVEAAT